eukprot:IDg2339t1
MKLRRKTRAVNVVEASDEQMILRSSETRMGSTFQEALQIICYTSYVSVASRSCSNRSRRADNICSGFAVTEVLTTRVPRALRLDRNLELTAAPMASKDSDISDLRLAPGWMSLGRKTRTGAPPAASPSSSSPALPRMRYTKAELLEVYEPGAPPGLPASMSTHTGITSIDALVPVNIAPEEDLPELLHSQTTNARVKPRGSPSRSIPAHQRHRFTKASSPPANGRPRLGVDAADRPLNPDTSSHHSVMSLHKNSNTVFASAVSTSAPLLHPTSSSASALSSAANAPVPSSSPSNTDSSQLASAPVTGGGGGKRIGQLSSNRDFWSGSAVLAPAERHGLSSSGERRPLALKPRSLHHLPSDTSVPPGANGGTSLDHHGRTSQQGSGGYWTRSTARGAADTNSNWRGGASAVAAMGSNSNNNVADPALPGPSAPTGPTSVHASSSASGGGPTHSSRVSLSRDSRDTFSRNKEALKPTNTRDLSALAKGSTRDASGSNSSSHYGNRERDGRSSTANVSAESKVQSRSLDPLSDTRTL